MAKILMYGLEGCPFCQKVQDFMDENGYDYERKDLPRDREDPTRKEIAEKSGVPTVPVIKVEDMYLGESADIIEYLKEHPELKKD